MRVEDPQVTAMTRRRRSGSGDARPPGGGRRLRLGVLLLLLAVGSGCASTPGFFGLEADPLFERGVAYFEDEEWNDAIAAFDHFLFSYPGEARSPEARMYLARAHFEKREFITAAAEFERFLQQFPSHGMAPEASLGICRSYERLSPTSQRDQSYTERAVDACRNTVNEFAGMNVAEEARTIQRAMVERLAQREYEDGFWYERRGLYDSAILVYQDLVDFFPQTTWAPKGFLGLYRSYRAISWDAEAEQVRSRLLANYPDSPEAAQVREGSAGDARGSEPPA
jgi:outer membrane protein assembly factor BamD